VHAATNGNTEINLGSELVTERVDALQDHNAGRFNRTPADAAARLEVIDGGVDSEATFQVADVGQEELVISETRVVKVAINNKIATVVHVHAEDGAAGDEVVDFLAEDRLAGTRGPSEADNNNAIANVPQHLDGADEGVEALVEL